MKRLIEEEICIRLYQSTQEESILLLNWWMELVRSGDLDKILFPSTHSLGAFMSFFSPMGKIRMVYVLDDEGKIILSAWGEAVANGVIFLSLWVKKEIRSTKFGVQATLDLYNEIFKVFAVVFGITKQERLLKVHKKWGYSIVAEIPGLWGGIEKGWLLQLTKENFLAMSEG